MLAAAEGSWGMAVFRVRELGGKPVELAEEQIGALKNVNTAREWQEAWEPLRPVLGPRCRDHSRYPVK